MIGRLSGSGLGVPVMNSDLMSNLTQLVTGSSTSEASLRTALRNVLVHLGFNAEIERNGADVVVLDRRLVIEIKRDVGPNKTGSRRDETQYMQLLRCINLCRKHDNQPTLFGTNSKQAWRGVLTNGQGWWIWDWHGDDETSEFVLEQCIFRNGEQRDLETFLVRVLERKRLF